tara:strand:+ start:4003 stop:4977 length:975 start_codon:yes stop_codon:yes gene_type:complete
MSKFLYPRRSKINSCFHSKSFLCIFTLFLFFISFFSSKSTFAAKKNSVILASGSGNFVFKDNSINSAVLNDWNDGITIWYHKPENLGASAPIVFVMHGQSRTAENYRDVWRRFSERGNFILIVPEISDEHFSGSRYNLGNAYTSSGKKKEKSKWIFSILERLFDRLRKQNSLTTPKYDIYGHSAGGQFVHRMVMFLPEARFRLAVAANAGWYTVPDLSVDMPYGIGNINLGIEHFRKVFSSRLLVLLGDDDDDPFHRSLRQTEEAILQGEHRLARGKFFYQTAKNLAKKYNLPFKWEKSIVPMVGHSNSGMAEFVHVLLGKPFE